MGLPYAPPCCLIKEELYANDKKTAACLLLTVAMLGTLFAGLPIASAASEALGNVTDAAVDGNTLLLTIDSGGSASDLLTLEVCQDNILRVDYQQSLWNQPRHPDY